MKVKSKINSVFAYLPESILSAVSAVPASELEQVSEIRLRLGKKLTLTACSKQYFLLANGTLSSSPEHAVDVTGKDIGHIYQLAMRNSLHSFKREITRGYVTVKGGCRIGFCGTAVLDPSDRFMIENVKDISCINIRIAREMIGCAQELYAGVFEQHPSSLLIAGAPSSGKTTLLRDLSRLLGNKHSVSLIDERNELASVCGGQEQNDVGLLTDVFTSYSKFEGIMTAVRVMSPFYLICDEIGSREDLAALEYAINSGVRIVASCHAPSIEAACKKPVIRKLLKLGAFDRIVLLGNGTDCGRVTESADVRKSRREELKC